MGREKKIGVRFFLNKRLKAIEVLGVKNYPIYVQITFDRKTHQCLAPLGHLSEVQFEKVIDGNSDSELSKQLRLFENKIISVIRGEYSILQDKFSFKGFTERLEKYDRSLLSVLENDVIAHFMESMGKELKPSELQSLDNELFSIWDLYKITTETFSDAYEKALTKELRITLLCMLYLSGFVGNHYKPDRDNEFDYVKVIDWLNSDLAQSFKDFLLLHAPIREKEQKMSLNFFKNESTKSPVLKMFYSFNLEQFDISLIISRVNKVIFG